MYTVGKRILWISAYAVAMALLEAVVVAYLRGLLVVTNDQVALGSYFGLEIWREVATMVMLLTVGWLAGRTWPERIAYSLFTFGLWDIWYYVWLKVFIDWPASLLGWDILFLIPVPWWGPVMAPALIAALICVATVFALLRLAAGQMLRFTPARLMVLALGGALALWDFMEGPIRAWMAGNPDWNTLRPEAFHWLQFLMALLLMAWPALAATWPVSRGRDLIAQPAQE